MNRESAGTPVSGEQSTALAVPEMDCPSCAEKIVNSVVTLDGVQSIEPQVMTGKVVVTYDAAQTDVEAISDRVNAAGYSVESRTDRTTGSFSVPGMDCPSCAGKTENALADVEGIIECETIPTTGKVVVTYDPMTVSQTDLVAAIESAGYDVEKTDRTQSDDESETDLDTGTTQSGRARER